MSPQSIQKLKTEICRLRFWKLYFLVEINSQKREEGSTCKAARGDGDTQYDRLEGGLTKHEDWHAIRLIYQGSTTLKHLDIILNKHLVFHYLNLHFHHLNLLIP